MKILKTLKNLFKPKKYFFECPYCYHLTFLRFQSDVAMCKECREEVSIEW